ncbi:MAG: polysaccharide deacetylase family protein [Cellvibrionaceae bacterium]|nr:polysaccharide deacetylase family protein [Cellvibrionaceae bacterium]
MPITKFTLFALLLQLFIAGAVFADQADTWPKKAQAAIVLTYDDAMDSQLDTALPQLNRAGLRATFYISPVSENLMTRLDEWRQADAQGHELANHMLHHPCRKSRQNDWVQDAYDLNTYSLSRYVNEIKMANKFLFAIDGKTARTFAYTCGHTRVEKNTQVIEALKPLFLAARAVSSDGLNDPAKLDYFKIRSQDAAGRSGAQLISMAEVAKQKNQLLVFLFHGVGAGHLSVSVEAHQALVDYLKKNTAAYWVTTLKQAVIYNKSRLQP